VSKGKFERTKPHVNVGTIGNGTMARRPDGGADEGDGGEFGGEFKAYDQIDKAPEERARGITIATGARGVPERGAALRARDCPGHADYVKNMITGAAQLTRRFGGLGGGWSDAADAPSTFCWRAKWGAVHRGVFEQADMVDDAELLSWWSSRCGIC